jgi:hypothetical protein
MARRELFTTVRTEGAILPPELLQRVLEADKGLGGLRPEDYHLAEGERLNEAANRAWNRLTGAWAAFRAAEARLPAEDAATTLTRERWLLPLFQELGYGRLPAARALELGGESYPISHLWGPAPVHLVGWRVDLDRRTPGLAGAARRSPHSLVQELLNRSDDHLWGFVANGRKLRILRDNASLTRQAYVEFDLEAIFEGEVYADFALLWLVAHQSRVEGERPEGCWLEKWSQTVQTEGVRALDQLRDGVQRAIEALGRGFLAHPANADLRERLRTGTLDTQDYYRQALRLVYRLIFLFVAEERGLLLDPQADEAARERYSRYYAAGRLRRLAERRLGGRHADLYEGLRLVMAKLGSAEGCPPLGLPALGGFLFAEAAAPDLAGAQLANADLLEAVRALAFTVDGRTRRAVDYKNLGAEEIGSVYESLLELHPKLHVEAATFALSALPGHERKTTGSYYTPSSLIQALLDSALDPVLDEAAAKPDPEAAILDLKVCDPAAGSGHFLIVAAHRIARRLAAVRTGDAEPAPEPLRTALRDVIGRCLYAVDVNPMAVELCKVALWLEALEPGRPLSFLDHHIQCGNSLLGTTPALLAGDIPDAAFEPIEGDDKAYCRDWKKVNQKQRAGQLSLLHGERQPWDRLGNLATEMLALESLPDQAIGDVQAMQELYESLVRSDSYASGKLLADAWCAAFVWKKAPGAFDYPITEGVLRDLERSPYTHGPWLREEVDRLARQYQFFHWHLAFPQVFRPARSDEEPTSAIAGWIGGFDVVLGNPPWERIKLQEKEWFAVRRPDIAAANAAQRRRMIELLAEEDPALFQAFLEDRRAAEGESHLVRDGERYPLTGRGDINTYALFAETNRLLQATHGRVGCILPSGIATDDTTKFFFKELMDTGTLVSLFDFENREMIFPAVDGRARFCLLTLIGTERSRPGSSEFAFFLLRTDDLRAGDRRFILTPDDLAILNPNTRTCPVFHSVRDAQLSKEIYTRVPVLVKTGPPEDNPWSVRFTTMFHMTNDSRLFRTRQQLEEHGFQLSGNTFIGQNERWLPIYEGKMTGMYEHRAASIEFRPQNPLRQQQPILSSKNQLKDPNHVNLGYLWARDADVRERISESVTRKWFLVFKRVTSATNERTVIACIVPQVALSYTLYMVHSPVPTSLLACFAACLNSFVFDYIVRQKTLQPSLPVGVVYESAFLTPSTYCSRASWQQDELLEQWISRRVLELTYTATDMAEFAHDMGYNVPPFVWDNRRRLLLRSELDAAFFHLYRLGRTDVDYILDTFTTVRRKDEQTYGECRTKNMILDMYDAMQRATESGVSYVSPVNPPEKDPQPAHEP